MEYIFDLVYKFLKLISELTGLTYREVNIIVYFFIIPSLFIFLVSRLIKKKYPVIIFLFLALISLLIIPDFEQFSEKLFDRSVGFLNWFDNIGLNYTQASAVICVIIPILIIVLLIYLKKKFKLKIHSNIVKN